MKRKKYLEFILLPLFLITAAAQVSALTLINGDMTVNCSQSKIKQTLSCDYRNKSAEPVLSITAEYANTILNVNEGNSYPEDDAITAVLLLVDTSDPARQNVIDKNIKHIKMILASSSNHHRFGLASFDKTLRLEAPIGSDFSVINNAAGKLNAVGKTTELYRSMLEAITLFKDVDADRKSIYIFSDGLAEDKAYFHNDVVNAAKDAGVIITSIAYPRSIAQSVSLQILRRLSEETGGIYTEANDQFEIPADFLSQPFTSLDNGGKFDISLRNIIDDKVNNETNLTLYLETDIGVTAIPVGIVFNKAPIAQPSTTTIIQQIPVIEEKQEKKEVQASPPPPIQIVSQVQRPSPLESWLWYGIPVALAILIILTIATFFISLRRQNKNLGTTVNIPEVKPYAFLITHDEPMVRHSIVRSTCRLGRSKNNEITLRDSSVSRRHAEIHRDVGDEFTLIDLNSLNGVFVNGEKIGRYKLQEGDLIEIGDVELKFTLMPTDYQLEESTVVQDTRVPSVN